MSKIKNKSAQAGNDLVKLFMLLVVISIAYSTYVVTAGTDGIIPTVLVIPQAVFATGILIKKFTSAQ